MLLKWLTGVSRLAFLGWEEPACDVASEGHQLVAFGKLQPQGIGAPQHECPSPFDGLFGEAVEVFLAGDLQCAVAFAHADAVGQPVEIVLISRCAYGYSGDLVIESYGLEFQVNNVDPSTIGLTNLIVQPTGNEKGKVFINGVPDLFFKATPTIKRLNFIVDTITDDYSGVLYNGYNAFKPTKISIPAGLPDNLSSGGVVEIELSNITVEQFSVVNKSQSAVTSVSMNQDVTVSIMSAFTPSLKLYSYEKKWTDLRWNCR